MRRGQPLRTLILAIRSCSSWRVWRAPCEGAKGQGTRLCWLFSCTSPRLTWASPCSKPVNTPHGRGMSAAVFSVRWNRVDSRTGEKLLRLKTSAARRTGGRGWSEMSQRPLNSRRVAHLQACPEWHESSPLARQRLFLEKGPGQGAAGCEGALCTCSADRQGRWNRTLSAGWKSMAAKRVHLRRRAFPRSSAAGRKFRLSWPRLAFIAISRQYSSSQRKPGARWMVLVQAGRPSGLPRIAEFDRLERRRSRAASGRLDPPMAP